MYNTHQSYVHGTSLVYPKNYITQIKQLDVEVNGQNPSKQILTLDPEQECTGVTQPR